MRIISQAARFSRACRPCGATKTARDAAWQRHGYALCIGPHPMDTQDIDPQHIEAQTAPHGPRGADDYVKIQGPAVSVCG